MSYRHMLKVHFLHILLVTPEIHDSSSFTQLLS